MMARAQISRVSAALLIHDLDHHLAALAKNGVKLPALASRFGDRLSRGDAQALIKLGMMTPEIQKALRDRGHPDHPAVTAYKGLLLHFAAEHPQDGDQPAAWNEPLSAAMRARLEDNRAFAHDEVTPGEAAAYRDYIAIRGDLQAVMQDKAHPDHARLIDARARLGERAAMPPDPVGLNQESPTPRPLPPVRSSPMRASRSTPSSPIRRSWRSTPTAERRVMTRRSPRCTGCTRG